jgi:hypothetical protein
MVGEIRLNADGFHSPHHLTFSYAICGHVDVYNQVYSQEGYQIDYFPPLPSSFDLIGWYTYQKKHT